MNASCYLAKLSERQSLDEAEALDLASAMLRNELSAAQCGAALSALRVRGESADELCGIVHAIRACAETVPLDGASLTDTCGTGGDGRGTFNVSTVSAIVAAAAGCRIAKHCNRAVTGRCGSADLLEALRIRFDGSAQFVAQSCDQAGVGFLFAPRFCRALAAMSEIRKQLGFRTVFNLAGPLANPARARRQLIGVFHSTVMRPMADAAQRLGIEHGLIVHGEDGMDEITISGVTHVCEVRDGRVCEYEIDPSDFGLTPSDAAKLSIDGAAASAALTVDVLNALRGPARDAVLLNAGATIYVAGRATNFRAGADLAAHVIDSGAALGTLQSLQSISQES